MHYLYEILSKLVSADTVSHKSSFAAMQLLADHLDGHGFEVRLQNDDQKGVRKTNLVAPGLRSPRGTSLEEALFELLDAKTCSGAPYCTDGGQFKEAGIDSLICGPGDLDQAHQPDESIGREAFESGAETVLRVLERLCGARSRG